MPGGYIQTLTGNTLTGTTNVTFTAGDDIEVTAGQKTDTEEGYEGDLKLPSTLQVTSAAPFQLLSSSPSDNSWGFTGSTITLTFNQDVTDTAANLGLIQLYQREFLDEVGFFAKTGNSFVGNAFEWDTSKWAGESSTFFNEPSWSVSATGKVVTFTTSNERAKNTAYEVVIPEDFAATGASTFEIEKEVTFTSDSYPSYVTPRSIRNEVFSVFDTLAYDYVHQLIWRHSIDAWRCAGRMGGSLDGGVSGGGGYIRRYVKSGTVRDIIYDATLQKGLLAGTSKSLGDMQIRYHSNAGNAQIAKLNSVISDFDRAKRAICYGASQARVFIKGWASNLDPLNIRQRLWKHPGKNYQRDGTKSDSFLPVSNTRRNRAETLPGQGDLWS